MSALSELRAEELRQAVPHGAHVLANAVRAELGEAVQAVLFYGSCLRTGDDQHSLLDFYVFVDRYGDYTTPLWAALNRLLPPNVFYFTTSEGERVYRLKYAVVSLDDLDRLTSTRAWQPYFWARFAQSCALVYARDARAERRVVEACARSVRTFIQAVAPLLPPTFTITRLWEEGLTLTYGTELRSEPIEAAPKLYRLDPERFAAMTRAALPGLDYPYRAEDDGSIRLEIPVSVRRRAALLWRLRAVQGKTLFLLRILKNWCTFEGGVEYVMWKIERHSGVKADPRWKEKRFRILAVALEAWRIFRKGGFR